MTNLFSPLLISFCTLFWLGAATADQEWKGDGQPLTLKILSYNVRNGVGLDKVTDYHRIASIFNRMEADAIAIQELDSATTRSKGVVVLTELAAKTGMYPTYSSSIDYQGGKYGVGMLTKEKPVSWKKIYLPGREEQRSLLLVELKEYVVCCTHFSLTGEDRLASVDLISEATNAYAKPVLLAGDLNAEPGTAVTKKLVEHWTMLSNPGEMTFPANVPDRCIDYILIRKDAAYRIASLESQVEAEPVASDHRPLWVKITLQKINKP
jgi:endonuclease/exonuclease/phosphatase family metal-dependent hydrolase